MKIMMLLVVTIFLTSSCTEDKPYQLHWGVNLEPLDFYAPASKRFKERVEKKTNGRVQVNLSIGQFKQKDRDHLNDVTSGFYDMGQETVDNLVKEIPEFSLFELPFLFKTNEQFFNFTKSNTAIGFLDKLSSKGVTAVEYTYSGGFINIYGQKMDSFEDLAGKEVTHESYSKNYKEIFEKLFQIKFVDYGSNEGTPPFSEIIASTINEMEGLPNLADIVLNRTEHRIISRVIFINNNFLQQLPEDLRTIVLEEAKLAGQFERELAVSETEVFLSSLQEKGLKVNKWSKDQKENGRVQFKSMYTTFVETYGPEIIEEIDSTKL
jgi:TRAP-type C4-dicarboxylate transport system substrate-binding protein